MRRLRFPFAFKGKVGMGMGTPLPRRTPVVLLCAGDGDFSVSDIALSLPFLFHLNSYAFPLRLCGEGLSMNEKMIAVIQSTEY